ncbi:MAG: hypothetical protein MAG451_02680 [Anaerolineales bacterium]|nr:hypothetical protein [Anaerolineales bacterium]
MHRLTSGGSLAAVTIASPSATWLQAEPRRLFVHSAFSRVVNLRSADGQFLTLLTRDNDAGPFAMRLAGRQLPSVPVGVPASAEGGTITLGDWQIDWHGAAGWNPTLGSLEQPSDVSLSSLLNSLRKVDSIFAEAVLPLSPKTGRGARGERAHASLFHDYLAVQTMHLLTMLCAGLQGNERALTEAVRGLLGFGPGLTPAGDDCLLGVLAARRMSGEPARILKTLVGDLAGRTTALSAAFLREACNGRFAGQWHHLRDALAAKQAALIEASLRRILAYGASSGADALGGWVIGMSLRNPSTEASAPRYLAG